MMARKFGPKVKPVSYILMYPKLLAIAREFGYTLAIHGSLQRDFDLIAVPWSEVADEPKILVQSFCQAVDGYIDPSMADAEKPHGRLAYVIHLGGGAYMDLSVMPRIEEEV